MRPQQHWFLVPLVRNLGHPLSEFCRHKDYFLHYVSSPKIFLYSCMLQTFASYPALTNAPYKDLNKGLPSDRILLSYNDFNGYCA